MMTVRFIRIIAVLFGVLASASILPGIYRTAFVSGSSHYRDVAYSEILGDFIISEYEYDKLQGAGTGKTSYRDRQGNSYHKEEMKNLLLLDNASQLAYEGKFPDSICGIPVTPTLVSENNFTLYYSARPSLYYGLLELRDRKSYTSSQWEPKDLFRIGKQGIEFILCASNTIDTTKSALFNNKLKELGFLPPARRMWTSNDKFQSELRGYYVTDSKEDLYLISMEYSKPVIRKLEKPDKKNILNLIVTDHPDFIAILITEEGDTYLQLPDESYKRLALPDARGYSISLSGNLFYRKFIYSNVLENHYLIFDRNYELVDQLKIAAEQKENFAARAEKYILPFRFRQHARNGFRFEWSPPAAFIWLNIVWIFLFIFLNRKKKIRMNAYQVADSILILFFGIYGFIAISMFPPVSPKRIR